MLDSRLIQIMPEVGNRYNSSPITRHYHNWGHIVALFALITKHDLKLNVPQYLALLFHDIVYEPGSPSNEADSVLAMVHIAGSLFSKETINRAEIIILDTKIHMPNSLESSMVLDLDMAILGIPEMHDEFNRTIREEYRKYSTEDYNLGRSTFFEELLKRPRIFHTNEFHYAYEIPARKYLREWCDSVK